jgi:hypothetical protein
MFLDFQNQFESVNTFHFGGWCNVEHPWTNDLTPRGRTGPTGTKPVLGSLVWAHTIFRILVLNVSQNKLCVSANFMILGATDQKLWVFENFRRSLGSQKTFYF